MVREMANRYRGLPPRTPDMLLQVIRKFYRGAVSHYAFIQEKKAETLQAWEYYRKTGESGKLGESLTVLFHEFHFYVTCWLQLDLALYRLARMEQTKSFQTIREQFHSEMERHLAVRSHLEDIPAAVEAQYQRCGEELNCVPHDQYWFGDLGYSVDQRSISALHELYQLVMAEKKLLDEKKPPCP